MLCKYFLRKRVNVREYKLSMKHEDCTVFAVLLVYLSSCLDQETAM